MGRPKEHECCELCGKPHVAFGLCMSHYLKRRRALNLGPKARSATTCRVDGCEHPSLSRGYCHTHYSRWLRNGDAGPAEIRSYPTSGESHYTWSGDNVRYLAAHRRVQKARGVARQHECETCGGPALDWAYVEGSPGERFDIQSRRPFSPDPAHYRPLCRGCHMDSDGRRTCNQSLSLLG